MFSNGKIHATFVFFICIDSAIVKSDVAPVVKLPQGQIQGHILQSPEGKRYYAYQDVPYASPPLGNLRFKEPVEPSKWDGVLNTTHNTHSCFLNGNTDEMAPDVTQSEDCLYLNVYTPVEPGTNSSIPVLFWIHGGGFFFGDGTFQVYGPQFLIDYDIVIVTINYRLGAFGFLTTSDGVIPGNIGLKDQHFAMQWVQTNIKLFGGDPTKLTIDGESAGGISVGLHVISKKSEGLFRGAILHSGTATCSFAIQGYPDYFAFKLAEVLGGNFTSKNTTTLLEFLQNISADAINNIKLDTPEEMVMGTGDHKLAWAPVIENENYEGAYITSPMHEDIRIGNINKVPIMIGYNSEEEIVFTNKVNLLVEAKTMDNNLSYVVKNSYNMTEDNKYLVGKMIRQLYTNEKFQSNISALMRYKTDANFAVPIIRHAELQSKYSDVYLYEFSYKGMMGCTNMTFEGVDAVGHAEDLKYLWHIDRLDDRSIFSVGDRLTQRRLLKLWSNFVKYLNPTPESDPLLGHLIWPVVTSESINYLNINRTLQVAMSPRKYQLFKTIVDRYAIPPLITY